jgi:hypothetical protein
MKKEVFTLANTTSEFNHDLSPRSRFISKHLVNEREYLPASEELLLSLLS